MSAAIVLSLSSVLAKIPVTQNTVYTYSVQKILKSCVLRNHYNMHIYRQHSCGGRGAHYFSPYSWTTAGGANCSNFLTGFSDLGREETGNMSYHSSASFLHKQLSGKEDGCRSTSWRWGTMNKKNNSYSSFTEFQDSSLKQMEGLCSHGYSECVSGIVMRKKVMVVVDHKAHSKHAMMWALTHATNKGDTLILLHVIPPLTSDRADSCSTSLVSSLGLLCKASKPEVEIEALVIQGPKFVTVTSQVKKLEVSVLVLGQKKYSLSFNPLLNCFCGTRPSEEFVDVCIHNSECLTIGVRKQSNGVGGYLISTKWQKDFWLLA